MSEPSPADFDGFIPYLEPGVESVTHPEPTIWVGWADDVAIAVFIGRPNPDRSVEADRFVICR